MNNVTIGIPLYNEEKYIADAIRSAAPQCSKLIISDNCSSDNSESICRELCNEFSNVEYIKQPSNIGAVGNFKYLLDKATTDYFMWLGAHDMIPAGYVDQLLSSLCNEKEAVLAYGNSLHIDTNNNPLRLYKYTFASELASNNQKTRLYTIIRDLEDCSLIHGIFIRESLKKSWQNINFLGGDHVLLALISLSGKMILNSRTHLCRREVHLNDNLQKQLTRIRGKLDTKIKNSKKTEMQIALFRLVETYSHNAFDFYKLKCHFYLASRFGSFSGTKVIFLAEYCIWMASRAIRLITRSIKFSK